MARRKTPVIADQLLDQLLGGADAKAAFEKDGLLDELKKALAKRVLNAEMDHHLETGDPQYESIMRSETVVSDPINANPRKPAQIAPPGGRWGAGEITSV